MDTLRIGQEAAAKGVDPILLLAIWVLTFLAALVLHVVFAQKWSVSARWNHAWFNPTKVTREHTTFGSLLAVAAFFTLSAFSFSLLVLLTSSLLFPGLGSRLLRPETLLHSPGLVFVLLASFATIWSLLNTVVLIRKEEDRFEGFPEFARRLALLVEDTRRLRPEDKPRVCYFVDYSPRVGEVSWPAVAPEVVNLLGQLRGMKELRTHILVLPSEELARVYERLLLNGESDPPSDSGESALELVTRHYLKAVEEAIEDLDRGYNAVWRVPGIDEHHFAVAPTTAIEYVVAPRQGSAQNELRGNSTSSFYELRLLERTAQHRLQAGITPRVELGQLEFPVEQVDIESGDLWFSETRRPVLRADPREMPQGVEKFSIPLTNGKVPKTLPLPPGLAGRNGFARVALIKHRTNLEANQSAPSVVSEVFEIRHQPAVAPAVVASPSAPAGT